MTQNLPRMTSPDDIEDDGDESLELTDQTELGRTVQHVNSEPAEPSNSIGQESSEPSGSAAAREDSLVAVSTILMRNQMAKTALNCQMAYEALR